MELFTYNSPEFKKYLEEDPHAKSEVEFLKSITEEGMTAVDVGGHKGVTAITIAKSVKQSGRLYCFEPVPEYFDILKKNLSLNKLQNMSVFELAVSDKVETCNFYVDGGASSMILKENAQCIRVRTTTLDTFLHQEGVKKIDLLNMDCEGSELSVLEGARKTLERNKVKIFAEIHHSFLKDLGYSVQNVVRYLRKLGFRVSSLRLSDLSLGRCFNDREYIYARK